MKVAFSDFWDGFKSSHNFFLYFMRDLYSNIELTEDYNEADILIYSCFGNFHKRFLPNKKIKIFYTGENIRPNFDECTYSFSFDYNSYGGRNVRIPLWLLQLDFYQQFGYENPEFVIPLDKISSNEWRNKSKTKFCAGIWNNAFSNRTETFNQLSEYKKVDGYGKPFKNWFYGEKQKLDILSDYEFSICYENSLFSGYYTEKLIHSYVAGNIPIYWADAGVVQDFNPKAFINLLNFGGNIKKLKEFVISLDKNPGMCEAIRNEVLFARNPTEIFEEIKFDVKRMLMV